MKKKILALLIAIPLVFAGFKVTERATFSRAAWLADFEQLEHDVERNYANLKWAAADKGVDFVALDQAARAALQQASSPAQARAALGAFVAGFGDAHFRIESGPPRPIAALMNLWPKRGEPRISFEMNAADACGALGYKRRSHSLGFEHARLVPDERRTFAAGVLTLGDGRRFGVLRIPLFRQHEYGVACEHAWQLYATGRHGECDAACTAEFEHLAKREVAAELARDARALQRSAPDGLIVDLTGNGGGTEWAEYAAFALTSATLKPSAFAFVRGAHWQRALTQDASELPAADQPIALALRDSARVRCDLRGIWRERAFAPGCWNTVTAAHYASRAYGQDLVQPQPYRGRLYIMMDANTASASEQFTAMLKDANAATTIGTRTMGAGCGYTNGGIDMKLRHSGLVIRMPDCARLRADGANEYVGIRPDIPVEWASDKGTALERALMSFR